MFSPERLNVLLSRSRNGLIMIGNADTFKNARKGKELWTKLLTMLANNKHLYEGFPVKCEQHPKRTAILRQPDDFDSTCPDGGCDEPWYVLLLDLARLVHQLNGFPFIQRCDPVLWTTSLPVEMPSIIRPLKDALPRNHSIALPERASSILVLQRWATSQLL